jgi:hypothetical protein
MAPAPPDQPTPPIVEVRCLSHHARLFDARFGRYAIPIKIYVKKSSKNPHILLCVGSPLSNRWAIGDCMWLPSIESFQFWLFNMKGFSFCEGPKSDFSDIKLMWSRQQFLDLVAVVLI